MKTLVAGLLLSAVVLVGTTPAVMAHHYDDPQYPMPAPNYGPGPIYNFYGPTTNYFGASPDDQVSPAGYDGPPAYYGEAPSREWQQLPPQQYYEDSRLDPWNGYNGDPGNGY